MNDEFAATLETACYGDWDCGLGANQAEHIFSVALDPVDAGYVLGAMAERGVTDEADFIREALISYSHA